MSKCPDNRVKDICKIIGSNLKLKASRQKPKWPSFEHAYDHVIRKFGFDYVSDNLLLLKDPTNTAGYRKEYIDDNLFSFNLRDAKSLVAKNKPAVTPNVINFVMQCLNFYIRHTSDQETVPSTCFGTINDVDVIVPDPNRFNDIYTHVKAPISSESSVDRENCVTDMERWFRRDDKGHLTRYLDLCHSEFQLIKNYTTVVPLNKQYFVVDVDIDIASSDPNDHKVTTYDYHNTHTTEVTQIRVWFAKYFGLYHMDFMDLDRNDKKHYNCHDIKQHLDKEGDPIDCSSSGSMFPNSASTNVGEHKIKSDAGLYAIMLCIEKVTGQKYISNAKFKDSNKRKEIFDDLRMRILQLMDDMYDAFNMMQYSQHLDHFCFASGDINQYKHLNKWYMIHDLFRSKVYKYSSKCNAMTQYKAISYKNVQRAYDQRNDEPDSKKRTQPLSNDQKESRKKAKIENYKKLSALKLFNLAQELNTRSAAVHNISSKRTIVLFDQSQYDIINQINRDMIYTPYKMYKITHSMFCWRYYNEHNPQYSGFDAVQKLFRDDMYKYKTFFAMDLMKDTNTGQTLYDVKASMIVELDLTFKNGSQCIVIHCAACKFGCDDVGYLETILYAMFKTKPSLRLRPVVFVWKYGSMTYLKHNSLFSDLELSFMTPKHLFIDMGFNEMSVPEMKNDLHEHSECLVGDVGMILSYCNTFDTRGKSTRICMFESSNRIKYRYSPRRPFGNTGSDDESEDIGNAALDEVDSGSEEVIDNTESSSSDNDNTLVQSPEKPSSETPKDQIDDNESLNTDPKAYLADSQRLNETDDEKDADEDNTKHTEDDENTDKRQEDSDESIEDSNVSAKDDDDGLRDTDEEKEEAEVTTDPTQANNNPDISEADPGFEIYTHTMLWMNMTEEDEAYLTVEKKHLAKNNPGVKYYFSGGGAREETNEELKDCDMSVPIPLKFQQSSYDKTESNCVILSAAMLVSLFDDSEADMLLDMFKSNQMKYEWIEVTKYPNALAKEHAEQYGKLTLQQILQKNTSYQLKKVPRDKTQKCFKNQLLNDMTHGKYIMKLKLEDDTQQHVIGIDCDSQLIYDCMEEYALPLTEKNLNNCGGKQYAKVDQIKDCWELTTSMKHKHKKPKK